MIRILFLAASPVDLQHLRIRQERNAIQRALDSAAHGKHFVLIEAFDVNVDELQELLFRHQPHIVHFSGHGEVGGELYLKDDNGLHQPVNPQALGKLLSQFKHTIQLVVLNACYSASQADAIALAIDFVVGMTDAITDTAAVSFAEAFYRAAANGTTLATMFELACNQLDLKNLEEAHKPHLHQRNDPQQMRFINITDSTTSTPKIQSSGGSVIAGNVETGHDFIGRDQIIINLVRGMADLPTHYDGPVRNFLSYYLGSATSPAPFGGRNDDLARLDQWLAESQMARYLLLAAPAGRGKSALLAHWVADLIRREAVHIVFFPISIRFSTNRENVVFSALAARLACIYGETLTLAIDAQQYRGVVSDYLQRTPPGGKRLLVVLDGLDEAAGWEAGADLFPLQPTENLRVVVAARLRANDATGEGWLTQLGWENGRGVQFVLPTLDRDSVADVLVKMGNPLDVLATKIDVVTRLHELSEGDPLLVRLYVEALLPHGVQMATFTPEDLLLLKPGIKAFFDRWFEEQKKLWNASGLTTAVRDNAVNSLLNLCALAKGPLSRDDLLALASNELPNGATIDWAAVTLNRFIIGDGSVENGYTFGHPRFGYYFAERLPIHERKHWHDRFLAYGRQLLTDLENKSVEPKDASPYGVRYYGAHLTDSKAIPAEFYALVCAGWLRAWEWIDGTPDGFLNDVHRSWIVAELEGATALGQVVRAALCFSSVVSLSANISIDLLAECAEAGIISPQLALTMARAKIDPSEKATCLARVSKYMPRGYVYSILADALKLVFSTKDEEKRASALQYVAEYLPSEAVTLLSEALDEVRSIEDEGLRVSALNAVTSRLSPNTNILLHKVFHLVGDIDDEQRRVSGLNALAARISPNSKALLSDMLNAVRSIADEELRTEALIAVAAQLTFDSGELLIIALHITLGIKDEDYRVSALSAVVLCLPPNAHDLLNTALKIACNIEDEQLRASALSAVIVRLPQDVTKLLTDAVRAIFSIEDERSSVSVFKVIVERLSPNATDLLNKLLCFAHKIKDKRYCAEALCVVAIRLPEIEKGLLLDEALNLAQSIENERERSLAVSSIHKYFTGGEQYIINNNAITENTQKPYEAEADKHDKLIHALSMARSINDDAQCVSVLSAVSSYLSPGERHGTLLTALSITLNIKDDEKSRALALKTVIMHLLKNDHELLNKALGAVHNIQTHEIRAEILSMMAERLPRNKKDKVLTEALYTVRNIRNEWIQTCTLKAIVIHLPTDYLSLYDTVLNIIRNIENEGDRASAIRALVASLPQTAGSLLCESLNIGCNIIDENWRASVLSAVASRLPVENQELLTQILNEANDIEDDWWRANMLCAVAMRLPEREKYAVLDKALITSRCIKNESSFVKILLSIIDHLPKEKQQDVRDEALSAAFHIADTSTRIETLCNLASHLGKSEQYVAINEALNIACNIDDEWNRVFALKNVAIHLPTETHDLQLEVLENVYRIVHQPGSVDILKYLVPHWQSLCQYNGSNEETEVIRALYAFTTTKRQNLLNAIEALLPIIFRVGGEKAVSETAQAILDITHWWP